MPVSVRQHGMPAMQINKPVGGGNAQVCLPIANKPNQKKSAATHAIWNGHTLVLYLATILMRTSF